MTTFDAINADEAFLCTTSFALLPVGKINGQTLRKEAPGPLTKKIIDGFRERVGLDISDQIISSLAKS